MNDRLDEKREGEHKWVASIDIIAQGVCVREADIWNAQCESMYQFLKYVKPLPQNTLLQPQAFAEALLASNAMATNKWHSISQKQSRGTFQWPHGWLTWT